MVLNWIEDFNFKLKSNTAVSKVSGVMLQLNIEKFQSNLTGSDTDSIIQSLHPIKWDENILIERGTIFRFHAIFDDVLQASENERRSSLTSPRHSY